MDAKTKHELQQEADQKAADKQEAAQDAADEQEAKEQATREPSVSRETADARRAHLQNPDSDTSFSRQAEVNRLTKDVGQLLADLESGTLTSARKSQVAKIRQSLNAVEASSHFAGSPAAAARRHSIPVHHA